MIYLMYVPGISRTDVPVSSTADPYGWLGGKVVKSIDNSYYPAYYEDTIYIDADDLDLGQVTINYLAINVNPNASPTKRTYYYFITDIRYVNEQVYEIDIVLDSIMTFMPEIHINYGLLERKLIHKYTSSSKSSLNRAYIRENVSDGIFYNYRRDKVTDLIGTYVARSTQSKAPDVWVSSRIREPNIIYTKAYQVYLQQKTDMELGYYYFVIPYVKNHTGDIDYTISTQWRVYDSPGVYHDYDFSDSQYVLAMLRSLLTDTAIKSLYYFPFNIYQDIFYNENNNTIKIFANSGEAMYSPSEGEDPEFAKVGLIRTSQDPDVNIRGYAIEWMKDMKVVINRTSINYISGLPSFDPDSWSPFDEVGIFDENYISVRFGENGAMSSFPLYKATSTTIYAYYWGDPTSGARYYQLGLANTPNNAIIVDFYNTRVCADKPLTVDLRTAEFEQWYRYNKAALIGAASNTAVKVATSVLTHGVSAASDATRIADIIKDPAARTPKKQRISKKAQRAIRGYEISKEGNEARTLASTMNSGSGLFELAANMANLALAPDSVKTIGELIGDMMADCDGPYIDTSLVQDYYQVGLYYHMYGYKINRPVHNKYMYDYWINDKVGDVFNYIKFGSVTVDLIISDISSQAICSDIESRLRDGVRFWKIDGLNDNFIGNYTKKNMEW